MKIALELDENESPLDVVVVRRKKYRTGTMIYVAPVESTAEDESAVFLPRADPDFSLLMAKMHVGKRLSLDAAMRKYCVAVSSRPPREFLKEETTTGASTTTFLAGGGAGPCENVADSVVGESGNQDQYQCQSMDMMNEGTTTSAPDVSTSRLCPVWRRALVTQLCQEIRRKTTDGPEAETTATTTSCGNPACEFRHEFLSRFEADQLRESAEASARCREEYERLALAHTTTLDGTRTTSLVSKHKRASVFAEWFAEKYGNKLKTLNNSSNTSSSLVQDKDLLILDVAGGSGDLSVILRAEHGFRNVYTIDPWKPRRWKTWQLRKMQDRTLVSRKREFDDESETNCGSAQILDTHFVQESFPMIWGGRAVASDDSGPPIGCSDRLRRLINRCDVIVGLHPDQATEAIVACAQQLKKPFAVVPCCVFAHLFPGRELMDVHCTSVSELPYCTEVVDPSCFPDVPPPGYNDPSDAPGGGTSFRKRRRPVRDYAAFLAYLRQKYGPMRCDQLGMEGKNIVLYTTFEDAVCDDGFL